MRKNNFFHSTLTLILFISIFCFLGAKQAFAINPDIVIPLGQVAPFEVPEGITTLVIGDPSIAEVVIPPGQNKTALINTKAAGITNILIWTQRGGAPNNFILAVEDIKRGEQIITRVKVLEVFSGDDGQVGIDWQDFLTFQEAPPSAAFKFGLPLRTSTLEAKINTLVNDRKARLLAQPTLVSLSGEEAKFLSGGEYPVLTYQRDAVTIQWRDYGIKLDLKARVEGSDNIIMTLKPELSSIDKANSVTITGTTSSGTTVIPAFTTRKTESTLSLKDGQTAVIAGLMSDTDEEVVSKFPLLGDIPVLGSLFKSVDFKKTRTELVFLVTPSILKHNEVASPEKDYAKDANSMDKK